MYFFEWDKTTRGYRLTTQTKRFVANEIRPVFAAELSLLGFEKRFLYDKQETLPLLWAKKNEYLLNGEKVAQLNNTQYGKPLAAEFFFNGKLKLESVDVKGMIELNSSTMDIIVADTKRRVKELYDMGSKRCDIAYIAFSGGKDSVTLLDICHRVLPLSVPVIFSDTDMELPDTYKVWVEVQSRYPEREFLCAKAESSALENWRRFGPPSRTIRWCCSVHKSTPAIMLLKDKLRKPSVKALAFVGVRSEESISRSFYEDMTDGAKNASQLNCMPILDWGSHELWLYIFANDLLINCAYKKGISRVGCLICPESTDRHLWFMNTLYTRETKHYNDILIETSNKQFKSQPEKIEFVGKGEWQARRSGVVLKEVITNPLEDESNLTISFQSPHFSKNLFYEWIKTLGTVIKSERTGQQQSLKLPNTLDEGIPFSYHSPYTGGGTAIFKFRDIAEKSTMLPLIRAMLRKTSSCIGCRTCEAECDFGAISLNNGSIKINGMKCIKCHQCYDINCSNCWRYFSMRYEGSQNNILVGINSYFTFGLRESWVATLIEMGENFFPWTNDHPLGNKMVPSASAWFSQAMLIDKTRKPTKNLALFKKYGESYPLGWDILWITLANNAVLIKWYVTSTEINKSYTLEELSNVLVEKHPTISKSAKECGIASLRDMLTKSPFGGENAVTFPEMKGRIVKSITRKAKEVNPLTVLYGLYLIASKADRGSFTVRELMKADEESVYISPITAFGISHDMFKKQCEGLKSKYPDYIETTFTHGNDELTLFPKKYSTEDIITLALGE
jgi:3'-phosphoadenosine 5'-phosphosulfate sulfotransferase (PAPS reductase)/FAD synthetase/ferredoxin